MDLAGPRKRPALALKFAALSAFGAALLAGCANPGPPRPPSLQLPEVVSDLSAERVGDRVLLRWTTPARTTDGLDIHSDLTAELCRGTGYPATKATAPACSPVAKVPVVPGSSSAWDDLPQSLLGEPAGLMTYRIQIFNAAGRSAGRSVAPVYVASGTAPAPPQSLTATASEAGVILRWKTTETGEGSLVQIARTDLAPHKTSPAGTPARHGGATAPLPVHRTRAGQAKAKPGEEDSSTVHLQVHTDSQHASSGGEKGTIDTTAVMGETYSYVAQQVRVVTIEGHQLEIRSQPSTAVMLAIRDTFPPKPPTGLATIPGTTNATDGSQASAYIDLSWEPNTEADLAGYLVYRQLARPNGDPEGPLGKLTPLPIAAPAYRDVAVAPGQRYSYSVTAVDASGNESAPSAKALEVAGPPQ